MRILLSSFLLLLMVGCASYPKKNGFRPAEDIPFNILNPYFSDTARDYVYKANIEAFDRTFGGLLILKKLDADRHRIVFTTEMGSTLFDFTLWKDDFKVNRILPEMDRKILINILKWDFRALTAEHPAINQSFKNEGGAIAETNILSKKHYFYLIDGALRKIVRTARGREKVEFLFSGINADVADSIKILHKTFPLVITLKKI